MSVFLVAASVAALAHVGFFVLESLLWTKPAGRKIFGTTEAEAETIKFMAFNQGFYNLFLAIGAACGVGLVASGRPETGRPVIVFACACMLGAAAILATGGKRFARGVAMQGLPPLIALVALMA
jgi:putative membrane protein